MNLKDFSFDELAKLVDDAKKSVVLRGPRKDAPSDILFSSYVDNGSVKLEAFRLKDDKLSHIDTFWFSVDDARRFVDGITSTIDQIESERH